jgi:hypothetical protein
MTAEPIHSCNLLQGCRENIPAAVDGNLALAAYKPHVQRLECQGALRAGAVGNDDRAGGPSNRDTTSGETRNRAKPSKAGYRFNRELSRQHRANPGAVRKRGSMRF